MEKLIQLILQNHPDFIHEVEGVSEKEIAKLESLNPFPPLPVDYKVFLKYMGKKSGRVKGLRKMKVYTADGEMYIDESTILIDYHSVLSYYKKHGYFFQKGFAHLLMDFNEKPQNFFLFGIDTLGNDNGNFYLDLRYEDLPVVEICDTRGIVKRAPTFLEFLFSDSFRRDASIYKHNKKWFI